MTKLDAADIAAPKQAEPAEQTEDDSKKNADELRKTENILLKHRTLTLFGEITSSIAQATVQKLLALAYESDRPITLYINSPGGHVESGDTIFDVICFIKPTVRVVGTGWVGSIATHIFLAPELENRHCLPNTRFLIHQPAGSIGGTAADVEIHAREILKVRERINGIIARRTGQSVKKVNADTLRDCWMDAKEALDYGLIGSILHRASELE